MYGQHISISGPFDSAVEKVTAALKNEGFGVLSDIDIQKAMTMVQMTSNPGVASVADEAGERLRRVQSALAGAA